MLWAAKYGKSGTASWSAIATIADSGSGKFTVDMLQKDSAGFGATITFSVSDKTTTTGTTRTTGNIGYVIGATVQLLIILLLVQVLQVMV